MTASAEPDTVDPAGSADPEIEVVGPESDDLVGDPDDGPDADPSVVSGDASTGEDDREPGDDRRNRLVALAKWVAFVVVSGVALGPILTTPIVADDFVMPFSQIDEAGLNPFDIWHWAVTSAPKVGHFNFIGQFVGGTTSLIWMLLISWGIKYSTVFAASKLLVYVLCAAAGARFVREGLRLANVEVNAWWARIAVAVALFGSLQLHVAWSNDPVASYPGSGFASVAFGLWFLSVVCVALRRGTWRSAVFAGVLGLCAVLYYEINVSAVVASAPIVLWSLWRGRAWKDVAALGRAAVIVGLPAAVTIVIQILVSPASANYTGTQIAAENSPMTTFGKAIVSSMPAAAWPKSRNWINDSIPIKTYPVVVITVLFVVLWYLGRRFGARLVHTTGRRDGLALAAIVASPLAYWLGATLIQSLTRKVQDEVNEIGKVYNFYAIGSACIAVAAVLVFTMLPDRKVLRSLAPVGVGLGAMFLAVQFLVNAELSSMINEMTIPNRELLVAYSSHAPVEERCRTIRTWTAGSWPDYYEDQIVVGMELGYQEFHDESFCPGFDRVAEGLGLPR